MADTGDDTTHLDPPAGPEPAPDPVLEPGLEPVAAGGRRPGLWLVLGLALVVVLLDQAAKVWAVASLGDVRHPVIGDLLGVRLVRNSGAAFSMATGSTWLFTVIATVVAIAIVRLARRIDSWLWGVALGFLLGGALGNLSDRLFREPGFARGHVVDFIEFPHFPLFNLADSAITLAAGLIILAGVRGIGIDGRPVST